MLNQATYWEEIFAKHIYQSLVSKTSREFSQVNNKEATQFFWNGQQDLNRHFTEDDIQMANKHTSSQHYYFWRRWKLQSNKI